MAVLPGLLADTKGKTMTDSKPEENPRSRAVKTVSPRGQSKDIIPEVTIDTLLDWILHPGYIRKFERGKGYIDHRQEAKARLNSLIEGIIGEDVEVPEEGYLDRTGWKEHDEAIGSNKTKAEQRKRLKQLGGSE